MSATLKGAARLNHSFINTYMHTATDLDSADLNRNRYALLQAEFENRKKKAQLTSEAVLTLESSAKSDRATKTSYTYMLIYVYTYIRI